MEFVPSRLQKVSIIERDGNRIWLNPKEMPEDSIEERIRKAIARDDEVRWYYLPEVSFEIIKTAVPPRYEQPWHSHWFLHESVLVIAGEILVKEENNGKLAEQVLHERDLAVFNHGKESFHTVQNPNSTYAHTLTHKFLGPDVKDKDLFKNDWHKKQRPS